jgi:acetoacetyl-[acyl-carrier protein] synthase
MSHGWLPGITSIDHIAEDVHHSHLQLPLEHLQLDPDAQDGAFINSKGFGGNNATGFFLSAAASQRMLSRRWGASAMQQHKRRQEAVAAAAADYDAGADNGSIDPIYRFGEGVLSGEDLTISDQAIGIPGYTQAVELNLANPYPDMSED